LLGLVGSTELVRESDLCVPEPLVLNDGL